MGFLADELDQLEKETNYISKWSLGRSMYWKFFQMKNGILSFSPAYDDYLETFAEKTSSEEEIASINLLEELARNLNAYKATFRVPINDVPGVYYSKDDINLQGDPLSLLRPNYNPNKLPRVT